MDKREKMRKVGYALALLGFAVALVSIVPGVFGKHDFPWTLIVGSFIYLHGGLLIVFGSRGKEARQNLMSLRFVRLGFVAIFAVLVWRLFAP